MIEKTLLRVEVPEKVNSIIAVKSILEVMVADVSPVISKFIIK
jgi:hypothetical protein